MKKYQKKRDLSSEIKAKTPLAIWPVFESGDPAEHSLVYRWFSNDGDYLGWTSSDEGKKFLLGKLYYKTKGAYRIQSKKSWTERTTKKIFIYEKGTSYLAGYAVIRTIRADDLVDLEDREALCKITLSKLQASNFDAYNFANFPNPYKIIPDSFRSKFHQDMQEFLASKKQELINYVNDDLNAQVAQRQNTHIHGIDLATF